MCSSDLARKPKAPVSRGAAAWASRERLIFIKLLPDGSTTISGHKKKKKPETKRHAHDENRVMAPAFHGAVFFHVPSNEVSSFIIIAFFRAGLRHFRPDGTGCRAAATGSEKRTGKGKNPEPARSHRERHHAAKIGRASCRERV